MSGKYRRTRSGGNRPQRSLQAADSAVQARPDITRSASDNRRGHIAHFALMFAALALSYLLPFELFVMSYAVLGPLHYLTEISWLHDRKYFLPNRYIAALLCLVALGAMFIANSFWLGLLVSATFVSCAIVALSLPTVRTLMLLAVMAVGFLVLWFVGTPFGLAWLLIPTLIHVCAFTLVFMVVGAYRSRSSAQFALIVAYLVAIAAIVLFPPSQRMVLPQLAGIGKIYFGDIAPALGTLVGVPDLAFDARVTGLLSFVYTYHYLNWFIKVDVIRWAQVPKARMAAIVVLSLGATGLYLYNYVYGFMLLILLSLIHVLLEFPLNSISLRQLGGVIGSSIRTAKTRA